MTSTQTVLPARRTWPMAGVLRLTGIYLELAKARLTALVLLTAAVGYALAADGPLAWGTLFWTILGTALTAGGANGLNQCSEAPADSCMARTRNRPVVSHRISLRHAWRASVTWAALGVFVLAALVNTLTAALGAVGVLLYVLIYTPLKQRSSACTLVGAAVGAIPPMMGVAAATGQLGPRAWLLAALLFTWQIPHSLALAWLYRDDYDRGGYRLLVWGDRAGRWTFHLIVLYCLALLPIGVTLSLAGFAGTTFAVGAILLGGGLLATAVQLYRTASDTWARRLFWATVIYLPVLLGLLLADGGAGR